MAFKKLDVKKYPPRQWALVGAPTAGKSTFATQMEGPILVVDSDHRFTEVAHHATSAIYELSDNPADNVNAQAIAVAMRENMATSGVKTVVIDSLTSILTPLVVKAVMDNDAGKNKNRMSAFKEKALALRLLQDTITGWGCNVLWIYHTRDGMDSQAVQRETTTVSAVELARLRRSLNMQLKVVQSGDQRAIVVEWARRGRSGMTIWDESGKWQQMPERIEEAVYGGLSAADMQAIEGQTPTSFTGPEMAIAWAFEEGCFRDAVHAANAYAECKREKNPKTPQAMWSAWIENVTERKAKVEAGEPIEAEAAQELVLA